MNNKQKMTEFYTSALLKESIEMLNYMDFNLSKQQSFIDNLRIFMKNFIVEQNPHKIDILLRTFSKQYYQTQEQKVFRSVDSVHMLSFATLMLDIEMNMDKVIEKNQLVTDFYSNLKGLNDGLNYDN